MAKSNDNASPGFLAPKPAVKKSNRKIMVAIVAAVTALVIVLLVTMTSQDKNQAADMGLATMASSVEGDNKPLTSPVEGFGLALADAPKGEPDKTPNSQLDSTKYVGPPKTDPEDEARRREADEIRRRKFEREQQAYGSIMLVQRGGGNAGSGSVDADGDGYIDKPAQNYTPSGPDAYDPAADQDKEQFFTRSDARDWISPHTREVGRTFELKTGAVIPGVMVSGINSDLPGHLIAQISQNVYDTATGRDLLLPQGSKLFGVYDSRVVYGRVVS